MKNAAPLLLMLALSACAGLSGTGRPRPPAGAQTGPVKPLEVQFMKASAVHLSFTKASFDFQMKIRNPNKRSAQIQSAEYVLKIGGEEPIQGKIDKPLEIPADGSGRLPILLNAPLSLFSGEERAEWTFEAVLTAQTKPFPSVEMRMSRHGRMPIPQPPKIHLSAILIHGGSEKGRFQIKIENPNRFLIQAKALQISPKLNGEEWKSSRRTVDLEIFSGQPGTIEMPFTIDYADLSPELSAALFKRAEVEYTLRGVLSVETPLPLMPNPQFPFETSGTAPVKPPSSGNSQ